MASKGEDRGAGGKPRRDNSGNQRRKRRDDRGEQKDSEFTDTLVPGGVFRCTAVVKGGRRLSFGALVVVGNGKGKVGVGYGKAKEVPMAIQKAIKDGHRSIKSFPLVGDGTIPHEINGRYGAANVRLIPAGPGTGIIAGSTVKSVLEMGGVHNVLTKSFGSNNRKNLVKATMNALENLRSRQDIEALRGVTLS
ncbi:MAG: 30S ribosomal protein S5 [Planctomycetota bacterium]